MKELSIKQKAERYDEISKEVKDFFDGKQKMYSDVEQTLNHLFPELKESEDERMWKLIKKYVHYNISDIALNADHITREQLESWLEKQGEKDKLIKELIEYKVKYIQETLGKYVNSMGNKDDEPKDYSSIDPYFFKTTDKPRFHEGDFIVNTYCRGKIIALTSDAYLLDTGQGIPFSCEDNVHLWTIQDAKDGDVLIGKIDGDEYILIFKEIKNGWIETYGHYYDAVDRFCVPSQLFCRDYKYTFCPATKEQRDLLFSKMKEAGYEWDAEKKKLKKIDDEEVNGEDYGIDGLWHAKRILEKTLGSVSGYQTDDGILDHKAAITAVKKLYEQKPTWTEEDEKRVNSCLSILQPKTLVGNTETMNTKWLKSLKERMGG